MDECGKEQAMADERDRDQIDRPPSEAAKGEKADNPPPATSTDEQKVETDLSIEDRFEATDN